MKSFLNCITHSLFQLSITSILIEFSHDLHAFCSVMNIVADSSVIGLPDGDLAPVFGASSSSGLFLVGLVNVDLAESGSLVLPAPRVRVLSPICTRRHGSWNGAGLWFSSYGWSCY